MSWRALFRKSIAPALFVFAVLVVALLPRFMG